MKRVRLASLLAIALAALAVTFASGAASPPPAPTEGTAQDVAVSMTECTKAQSERTGAWFCPDVEKSKALMEASIIEHGDSLLVAQADASGISATDTAGPETVAAAGDGVNGWCSTSGCWYLANGRRTSEYHASGGYGYKSTLLGTNTLRIDDVLLNGNDIKVNIQRFVSSRGVRSSYWSDYQYRADAAYPYGTPCGNAYTMANVNTAAYGAVQFSPVYFKGSACAKSTQAIFHRIYWRDPNPSAYPGRWYLFAKSAKFTFDPGHQMLFQGTTDTPSAPLGAAGAGWQLL